MTNRKLADIVEGQTVLTLGEDASVREACRCIWQQRKGSVLVVDHQQRLVGIFTGRDAVRTLAEGRSAEETNLADAMTRNPITAAPADRAVDALRKMGDYSFRHLPIVENGRILGVVSRRDFKGVEIDRLDEEDHLMEHMR